MAQISDQSDFLKTALRLPRDLHARIQKAAELSGRSMNAEIIARMQRSFDEPTGFDAQRQGVDLSQNSEPLYRLYVLLDSSGYPLSWAEIHELLSAINSSVKLAAVETEVQIITPDMESSSRRTKAAADLARRLRADGESRLIDNVVEDAGSAIKDAIAAENTVAASVGAANKSADGEMRPRSIRIRKPPKP